MKVSTALDLNNQTSKSYFVQSKLFQPGVDMSEKDLSTWESSQKEYEKAFFTYQEKLRKVEALHTTVAGAKDKALVRHRWANNPAQAISTTQGMLLKDGNAISPSAPAQTAPKTSCINVM